MKMKFLIKKLKEIKNLLDYKLMPKFKIAPCFEGKTEIIATTINKNNLKTLILTQNELSNIVTLALYDLKKYPNNKIEIIDSVYSKNKFFIVASNVIKNADIRVEIYNKTIISFNIIIENYNLNIYVANYEYLEILKEILNKKVF